MADKKPEQALWDRFSRAMRGHWIADRVENTVGRDMPDVFFTLPGVTGWIELKQIFRWNRRKDKITKVPHFTHGQKKWLSSRHRSGANCWLLLHIQLTNEYLLIPGDKARCVGQVTQEEVYLSAYRKFIGLPSPVIIRQILENGKDTNDQREIDAPR